MWFRALRRALAYRLRHRSHYDTPLTLSFLVTARCNLKCQHCFYHYEIDRDVGLLRRAELGVDEYRRLAGHLPGLTAAIFAGGEPFLRRDLAEIVEAFLRGGDDGASAQKGLLFAGIPTNGQLTQSVLRQTEAICRVEPSAMINVSLSLEGFRDVHDTIRGQGSFDRARRTWRELQILAKHQKNLMLTLTTVVNRINQGTAKAFIEWARTELRPTGVNVLLVRQSPRGGDTLKTVDPDRYREAQQAALAAISPSALVRKLHPYALFSRALTRHVERTLETGRRCFHCFAGVHNGIVDYKGDVNVCEVLMEDPHTARIGNLKDHDMDFRALWNSPEAARLRRLVNRHPACQGCTHETMGYMPSLLFRPNALGWVLGSPNSALRPPTSAPDSPNSALRPPTSAPGSPPIDLGSRLADLSSRHSGLSSQLETRSEQTDPRISMRTTQ